VGDLRRVKGAIFHVEVGPVGQKRVLRAEQVIEQQAEAIHRGNIRVEILLSLFRQVIRIQDRETLANAGLFDRGKLQVRTRSVVALQDNHRAGFRLGQNRVDGGHNLVVYEHKLAAVSADIRLAPANKETPVHFIDANVTPIRVLLPGDHHGPSLLIEQERRVRDRQVNEDKLGTLERGLRRDQIKAVEDLLAVDHRHHLVNRKDHHRSRQQALFEIVHLAGQARPYEDIRALDLRGGIAAFESNDGVALLAQGLNDPVLFDQILQRFAAVQVRVYLNQAVQIVHIQRRGEGLSRVRIIRMRILRDVEALLGQKIVQREFVDIINRFLNVSASITVQDDVVDIRSGGQVTGGWRGRQPNRLCLAGGAPVIQGLEREYADIDRSQQERSAAGDVQKDGQRRSATAYHPANTPQAQNQSRRPNGGQHVGARLGEANQPGIHVAITGKQDPDQRNGQPAALPIAHHQAKEAHQRGAHQQHDRQRAQDHVGLHFGNVVRIIADHRVDGEEKGMQRDGKFLQSVLLALATTIAKSWRPTRPAAPAAPASL